MLKEINETAIKLGVSDSDIVRMAVKEYIKRKNR
jgi:metal-responsive CopG/Arc/MetJ family transcriptional regulator